MIIGFYIDEMNLRGIANSIYSYAHYNEKILKNKSIIFFNDRNHRNLKEVIDKFKKRFKVIKIQNFLEIDSFKEKLQLDFIYVQKSGNKDMWVSNKIKTLIHAVYPQKLYQVHGHKFAFISKWLTKKFSNNKIDYVPYIVENYNTNKNLKSLLKIKKNHIVFGCHGGDSSFDLKFVQDAVFEIVKNRDDIFFLFLNINKFVTHPRIIFLKGTSDNRYKRKFLNTCDAMIYARSLGESFGLACGEFAILGKKIISYKFNRHKNHTYSLSRKQYIEYHSFRNLFNILNNFKKDGNKIISSDYNEYLNLNSKKVMKIFKNVFLTRRKIIKINSYDGLLNLINYIIMLYNYLNHKIYNHYYNFFYKKILKK